AGAVAAWPHVRRRSRREHERRAEVPEHFGSLRQSRARIIGRPACLRAAYLLRSKFAQLHARDSAVLADGAGCGRGRRDRCPARDRATRRRHRRAPGRACSAGRLSALDSKFIPYSRRCEHLRATIMAKPPFRADHVGSFLRPKYLLEAREKKAKGEISAAEL